MRNLLKDNLNQKYGETIPKFSHSTYQVFGVPKKTFGKYLRNEIQPRIDELERIGKWLGVNPKELY